MPSNQIIQSESIGSGDEIRLVNGIIPIVDFSGFSIDLEDSSVDQVAVDRVSKQLHKAFSEIGFVYIINHGVDKHKLQKAFKLSDEVFNLPVEVKESLRRPDACTNHGWVKLQQEILNPFRGGDFKECYDISPRTAKIWPDDHVPGFRNGLMSLYQDCEVLSLRILEGMAAGLGLDRNYFNKCHNSQAEPNMTSMRCLHYGPIPPEYEIKPDQIWCGEHSDYGSITLLFQDDAGGLEICHRNGQYVAATPLDGAVIVNIGDLMQRWTSDKLKSTKHRVVLPKDETKKRAVRRSFAFFVHPHDNHVIKCIDGSDKYQPITTKDYKMLRFRETNMA